MRAPTSTLKNARRLRRELSSPEVRLWVRLRKRSASAPVFRRQFPLGPYVLDFYCAAARLCVEVDGWGHNAGDQPARDERRDRWLAEQGVETLRIPASEVMRDPDEMADVVFRTALGHIAADAPSTAFGGPPPPLRREGE